MTERISDAPLREGETPCSDAPVETGAGCTIGPDGFFSGCVDTYSLCGGINRFPDGTCTRRIHQEYLVAGQVVARNDIAFIVTRTGRTRCQGTVEFAADPNSTFTETRLPRAGGSPP